MARRAMGGLVGIPRPIHINELGFRHSLRSKRFADVDATSFGLCALT